jgi:SAM-dependent methyltransferase
MPVELAAWMTRLEERHLADLRFPEVSRALRALSSAYVERRHTAIAAGRVLDGAGKRAAFALYYGPLHFLSTERILSEVLGGDAPALGSRPVLDLGCGTGSVGAAAASVVGARVVSGVDTHPWALEEARATYAAFGLSGSVTRGSAARMPRPRQPSLIVAGYVANEMPDADRQMLRKALEDAVKHGSRALVIEPLSKSAAPWWPGWVDAFTPMGARADEWRLTLSPPPLTRRLGDAAGLTSTQANVRSLWI